MVSFLDYIFSQVLFKEPLINSFFDVIARRARDEAISKLLIYQKMGLLRSQ